MNKILLKVTLAAVISVLFYVSLKPQPDSTSMSDAADANIAMPWHIDVLTDGSSRVFGLQLEETSVAETLSTLGEDHELAIISDQNDRSGLEIYYSHFSAGPIKGRLVIGVTAAQDILQSMQERAASSRYTASGSRKFLISEEDLRRIQSWPINTIAFIPSASLDEAIIQARFGPAERVVVISDDESHFLYPQQGLDITLNASGKEVLQYVAPRSFNRLAEPLESQAQVSEAPL